MTRPLQSNASFCVFSHSHGIRLTFTAVTCIYVCLHKFTFHVCHITHIQQSHHDVIFSSHIMMWFYFFCLSLLIRLSIMWHDSCSAVICSVSVFRNAVCLSFAMQCVCLSQFTFYICDMTFTLQSHVSASVILNSHFTRVCVCLSLSPSLALSSPALTNACSLVLFLLLSLLLFLVLSLVFCLFLFLIHTHPLFRTRARVRTLSLSHTHTHRHQRSLSRSFSPPSLARSLSHTHTHTHTQVTTFLSTGSTRTWRSNNEDMMNSHMSPVTWHVWHDLCVSYLRHDQCEPHVWHDWFLCVAWVIHKGDTTHLHMCHDSLASIT